MARLAENQRVGRRVQRSAALRWIAAVASSLGAAGIAPMLATLVRPLYRLTENGAGRSVSSVAFVFVRSDKVPVDAVLDEDPCAQTVHADAR